MEKIRIRGTEIEDVEEFTYLEIVATTRRGTDEDIKANKAQQAFAMLRPGTSIKHQNKDIQSKRKISPSGSET